MTTLREDFETMIREDVEAIGRERRDQPTDRARAARAELRRRRLLEAAARDRQMVAGVLVAALGSSWSLTTHAADWPEWAGWVRLALDFKPWESARRIAIHPSNNGGTTVSIPPVGARWTFWPPHGEDLPAELVPLAEELARRGVIE